MTISVLYLLGCNEGPSKRYRVFNHIEALTLLGLKAEWIWDIDSRINDLEFLSKFSIVVAFRSGWNERVSLFFKNLEELAIPIVYDIDDLVFEPTMVEEIDSYRRMDLEQQASYRSGVDSIRYTLSQCDYITTSTNYLRECLIESFKKPVFVVPFGVNLRQIEISKMLSDTFEGPKFIGYLSGTNSHQADFAVVAPAIRRILEEYDDVYLKLIGYLDVDQYLSGLEHRICKVDFMDWQYLMIETATCYVNLAPFDVSSSFCRSKSELKFVEAAISGVPLIASAVPSFCEIIKQGVNGFIAQNEGEWYQCIKVLIDSPSLRNKIAIEAKLTAARSYYPVNIGSNLRKIYSHFIELHLNARKAANKASTTNLMLGKFQRTGLRITWVIPQPFEGSGGHRNIFRAIKYLSEFGHSCSLYVLPDNNRFTSGIEVQEFIHREFFDIKADIVHWGVDDISEADVMVCTYWTTAYVIDAVKDRALLQVYFLQDFEPMFFPMGVDYVRAMATYKLGFYPLTSGPWPLQMLHQNLGIDHGSYFRFPIDRDIYYPGLKSALGYPPKVVFFARPDMPRRCYILGVMALEILKQLRPDVEIIFYGDRSNKYNNVSFEFTNLGMTDTIFELGELYRTSDIGLCFSTTNPSLVPFEMMACGLPVVDLNVNGNEINYGSLKNCTLVEPLPNAIANGIMQLLENSDIREMLCENGINFSNTFPTELEMAKNIEQVMLDQYMLKKSAST